ncbi:MAG: response regulator transcription factor [Egibacteraceae bacterium]
MDPTRVLIVDDHPLIRSGLRVLLAEEPSVVLVGEAATGEQAIAAAAALEPDIVLMDLNLPDIDGVQATRQILEEHPHSKVVVLTMLEDDDSLRAALRAGARGYLLKGAGGDETVRAILSVAAGDAVFSAPVADRVLDAAAPPPPAATVRATFPELTDREHDVLVLVAQGCSNSAIAEALFLQPKTVRNYVSSVLAKLNAEDRIEALLLAREAGLGQE